MRRGSGHLLGSPCPALAQHFPLRVWRSAFPCFPLPPLCWSLVHEVLFALEKAETSLEKLQAVELVERVREGASGQPSPLPVRSRAGQWGQSRGRRGHRSNLTICREAKALKEKMVHEVASVWGFSPSFGMSFLGLFWDWPEGCQLTSRGESWPTRHLPR